MDHPGSLSPSLPGQPWRLAALVAAAIAALELLLLVLVGLAFAAKPFAREAEEAVTGGTAKAGAVVASGSRPGSGATAPPPALSRVETSVLVLNGNGVAGAAATVAERVRQRGYLVAGAANAPRSDFARSLVMFRPGFRGEAARLAADLGIERVAPLDGLRAADLQGAHVALVVGRT